MHIGGQAVIRLTDYGIRPDTGKDAQPAMRMAIEAAAALRQPAVIVCEPGRYDFYPDEALRIPYYISNTASETENPDVTKTIGLRFCGLRDVALDGQGALFVFHGKQTMFVIDGCERIDIRNVRVDYERPTVVEMTVEAASPAALDLRVHPDARYAIEDGRLVWLGDGWRFHAGPMQQYDPATGTTWRIDNVVEQAAGSEELAPGLVRLRFERAPDVPVGAVLQARDGIRDQVGAFIADSRDVRFRDVGFHFMHGLGVVGQFSENLAFERVELAPRPETGRTVAAFADFIHLSGCRGTVRIADCRFAGAHDDAINVHGTYLRIVGRPGGNRLRVRFMHHQTYGFAAFRPGDAIEFVRRATLAHYADNVVESARPLSLREIELTLRHPLPDGIREDDVVENVTWTPEVVIVNNRFSAIPTRGILATTRRPVLIAGNTFDRMAMSAVLVADEAGEWYESGRVADMTIRGNRFIACGNRAQAVIQIHPEAPELAVGMYVHRGIRIEDNAFLLEDAAALDARHTDDLTFAGNTVANALQAPAEADAVRLTACGDVDVRDNRYGLAQDEQGRKTERLGEH